MPFPAVARITQKGNETFKIIKPRLQYLEEEEEESAENVATLLDENSKVEPNTIK